MDELSPLRDRLLVRLDADRKVVVEVDDIFYLDAEGETTVVRRRDAESLVDRRRLGEIESHFEAYGFLRIHRNYMVNLRRIREIRRRRGRQDWEVKLDPPVNKVLPVSKGREKRLWQVLGD